MRSIQCAVAALSLLGGAVHAGNAVKLSVDHVFAPKGFDSNDETAVMALVWVPSPCYSKPEATAKRKGNTVSVTVTSVEKKNEACIQMAYPALVTVGLGQLDEGDYRVVVNGRTASQKEEKLSISKASNFSIDDFTYARVSHVSVDDASMTATLSGVNPSDCLELDRINFISNDKDTVAVLPIMKQVKSDCERKAVPFNYTFDVPRGLPSKDVLLHVRSLEGSAVNELVSLK